MFGLARATFVLLVRGKAAYIDPYIGAKTQKPATKLIAGFLDCTGAGEMNRTPDLLITNELLYRLSYTGKFTSASNYTVA